MTNRLYKIYRVIRAVLFTIIILAVALPVITYVLLSIKPVQNFVRNTAETELTKLIGADVEIGDLNICLFYASRRRRDAQE
ncbi:MAG: hypothetical protein K2M80_06705, partial [Muribaculaceae bacterium]|nr:hypothetical protein [Muribaculaceae bacterium]